MYHFAYGQIVTVIIPAGQRPWNFGEDTKLTMTVEDTHGQDQQAASVDDYLSVRGPAWKGDVNLTTVRVGWVQGLASFTKEETVPKRIVVLEPTAIFDARSAVVTAALERLGDQIRVERVEPFEILDGLENFSGRIEGADLLIFLEATKYYRVLVRMVARTHPRIPVFLAGHGRALLDSEEYPPNVVLFATTLDLLDQAAVPEGMFYFDAATLRSKIVEILSL